MPFGKILAVFFISTGDAARSASVKIPEKKANIRHRPQPQNFL
jgi:hypothetical protein